MPSKETLAELARLCKEGAEEEARLACLCTLQHPYLLGMAFLFLHEYYFAFDTTGNFQRDVESLLQAGKKWLSEGKKMVEEHEFPLSENDLRLDAITFPVHICDQGSLIFRELLGKTVKKCH